MRAKVDILLSLFGGRSLASKVFRYFGPNPSPINKGLLPLPHSTAYRAIRKERTRARARVIDRERSTKVLYMPECCMFRRRRKSTSRKMLLIRLQEEAIRCRLNSRRAEGLCW